MRIALLGGSFNPPHLGHVGIIRYVLGKHLSDEVWVVPAAAHPYAKPLAKFSDRMEMCRLAFQGIPNVVVSDIESQLPQPSYTVQTLRHLATFPSPLRQSAPWARGPCASGAGGRGVGQGGGETSEALQLYLIIGSDIIADIPNWKDSAEILRLAALIEVPRGAHSPIPDVSATSVRDYIAHGKAVTDQVPAPVARYIQSHHLYR